MMRYDQYITVQHIILLQVSAKCCFTDVNVGVILCTAHQQQKIAGNADVQSRAEDIALVTLQVRGTRRIETLAVLRIKGFPYVN